MDKNRCAKCGQEIVNGCVVCKEGVVCFDCYTGKTAVTKTKKIDKKRGMDSFNYKLP